MARKVATNSWRTVRFFLDEDGVYEVCFDGLGMSQALRCTCPSFRSVGGCAHTQWSNKSGVAEEMREMFRGFQVAEAPDQDGWRMAVLSRYQVEVL